MVFLYFLAGCIYESGKKVVLGSRLNRLGRGQSHVIVKPNLLIFKLLAGYGYLLFGYDPGPDPWHIKML